MRPTVVTLGLLLSCAASVAAQQASRATDSTSVRLPRWHVGLAAGVGQAVGDFKRNVDNAAGVEGHALLRLDRNGIASLRLQGGWLNYGHESQRTCLGTAPQCRVTVNLNTINGILSLAIGPQLDLPIGRVRAYGYGLVGMSRFATVSGIDGGLTPDIVAGDENFGDGGLLLSGGIGMRVPVSRRISIDFGVGYDRHGSRNYLLEGGLTDRPDGTLGYAIKRSSADMFVFRLGLTSAITRKRRPADLPR